jgi:hypothetical protein
MIHPSQHTPAQAADPSTPAEMLASIASYRPDLRVALASNPAIYPELLAWLRSLGDPAVNAALDARGAALGMLGGGVAPPAHTSAPYGSTAHPASPNPQSSVPTPSSPAPSPVAYPVPNPTSYPTVVTPLPTQDWNAVPAGPTPSSAAYYAVPDGGPAALGPSTARKKSRRGLWIGLTAVLVLLVGAGAFAANALWFSKVGGADTPEAAVTQLVEGLAANDAVAMYGVISPAEVSLLGIAGQAFSDRFGDSDLPFALEGDPDMVNIDVVDLAVTTQVLEEGLAKVTISDGSFTMDLDIDAVADAMVAQVHAIADSGIMTEDDLFGGEAPSDKELRDSLRETLSEGLPMTVEANDLVLEAGVDFSEYRTDIDRIDPFLMVVEEDGAWYVSPALTLIEYRALMTGVDRGSLPADDIQYGFDSPEAAADGLLAGAKDFIASGAPDEMLKALPFAERRAVSLYGSLEGIDDVTFDEFTDVLSQLDATAEFSLRETRDNLALVKVESLSLSGEIDGSDGHVTLDGGCLAMGEEGSAETQVCVDEIPALVELGIPELSLVAVKEDGRWYISGIVTGADASGLVLGNVTRLFDEGKLLDEQWWEDNLGDLLDDF